MTRARSGRYRIGSEVETPEAHLVAEVLEGNGWSTTSKNDWDLAWLASSDAAIGVDETSTKTQLIVGKIPGVQLLERKDVVLLGARRARRRRGLASNEIGRGVPETYAMPWDDGALREVIRAAPDRRWHQVPLLSVPGRPTASVDVRRHPDRSSNWVVQEEIPGYRINDKACFVRVFALLCSLDPLVVYLLCGDLTTNDAEGELDVSFDLVPGQHGRTRGKGVPPVDLDRLVGQVADLLSDVTVGSREDVLRFLDGHPMTARTFQLIGMTLQLDEELAPWLVEIDPSPLAAVRSDHVGRALVDQVISVIDEVYPSELRTPERVGRFVRVVPSIGSGSALKGLAFPRPLDLALAGHCGQEVDAVHLSPAPGLRWWLLGDQVAFFVPTRGVLLITNPSGAFVWLAFGDGLGPGQIGEELAEAFGAPVETTQAEVSNVLGEWIDSGIMVRSGQSIEVSDCPATTSPVPVKHQVWNIERVCRCLGMSISVRYPSREIGDRIDRALEGMIDPSPTEIAAFCEIERDPSGWIVVGTHFEPLPLSSAHQLPAAVRLAVLTSAARTATCSAFFATALFHNDLAVVVIGGGPDRAQLVVRWIASGGKILADNLVALDAERRVEAARIGFMLNQDYQWIDGAPPSFSSPDAPNIGLSGSMVRFWFPPRTTMSVDNVRACALVTLLPVHQAPVTPMPPGEMLGLLLSQLPAGRRELSEAQAAETVEWVSTVPCYSASASDPLRLVGELRALCGDRGQD